MTNLIGLILKEENRILLKSDNMDENKKREIEFHRNRRMFAIVEGKLFIAPENISLSHGEWIRSENLLDDSSNINDLVRGFIDSEGVYFYKGEDFSIDEKSEKIFFRKLKEIIERLEIDSNTHIFGGMVKQEKLGKWPPKKDYGAAKDFIKK